MAERWRRRREPPRERLDVLLEHAAADAEAARVELERARSTIASTRDELASALADFTDAMGAAQREFDSERAADERRSRELDEMRAVARVGD